MADRRMSSNEMASHAIAPRQWNAFLAEFTEYNRGAHGQVEILGGEISRLVETGNRPFIGISADTKDGESIVWIVFGTERTDHLTHGIQHVTAIMYRPPEGLAGAALEIDAQDGTKTLVELSMPQDYALPPGQA